MIWLTDHITEHLEQCHKWPRICSTCRKRLSHWVCSWSNTTGATSGAGTADLSGAQCFVVRCLSFCPFSFGHCVVCLSSIYGFWLSVWYSWNISENKKITSLILIQCNPEIPKFICQNHEFRRKINRFSQSWLNITKKLLPRLI